jgi:hypothetical protein
VINQTKKFFGLKKVGWVLTLVGAFATLASLLLPLSVNLRGALRAFGFALMIIAYAPIWYADWKQHKPTSKDFSSKSFFVVYVLLVLTALLISAIALKNYFTNPR